MAYTTLEGGKDLLAQYVELNEAIRLEAEACANLFVDEHFGKRWSIETWEDDTPPLVRRVALLVGSAEYVRLRFAQVSAAGDQPPTVELWMEEARRLTDGALSRGQMRGTDQSPVEPHRDSGLVFQAER